MEIFVADTHEALAKQAADDLIRLMGSSSARHPLLCPASGDSPAGLFGEMVDRASRGRLDISNWYFAGLDEWVGMNEGDEGSCRYHLDRQLFHPLQVPAGKICFFDGRAEDLQMECERTEDFIRQHGGIEVIILGLGLNGHAGMNEPGTPRASRSHISKLDTITKDTGQKYFKESRPLTEGITLGLATIMEARHILLLVSGAHKAAIVQKMLEAPISEALPASLLRLHADLKIYLDKGAASLAHIR